MTFFLLNFLNIKELLKIKSYNCLNLIPDLHTATSSKVLGPTRKHAKRYTHMVEPTNGNIVIERAREKLNSEHW